MTTWILHVNGDETDDELLHITVWDYKLCTCRRMVDMKNAYTILLQYLKGRYYQLRRPTRRCEVEVLSRTNSLLSLIRHGPHRKRRVQFFYRSVCIRYRGNVFTESLPRNDTRNTHTYRHTDWWERFMKQAVEVGSGVIIYIPCFIKIGSAIQMLMGGGIHRQHGDGISLLSFFFRNNESRLKMRF
jgi:hypothetical protein